MATASYPNNNLETLALPAQSAVAWSAVLAGAAAAAALSLILLVLGSGLGLSSVSPWAQEGVSATTFGISTIVWLTLTQLLASGMGGYIAGRLRTRWTALHTDEVYFRDTVHGFLAWAVASLAGAALLGSVISSIVSGSVQAGAVVASGAATVATTAAATTAAATNGAATDYFVDSLFRKDMAGAMATEATPTTPTPTTETPSPSLSGSGSGMDASTADTHAQSLRIFMNSVNSGPLPVQDLRYLGHLVAQRTGLSQADAEKRVSDTYTRMQTKMREAEVAARNAADKARKATSYAALWLFISLLMGAFVASYCATWGGRQRDAY